MIAKQDKLTKPVVDPEVWDTVPDHEVSPAKLAADEEKERGGDQKSKVGQQDQVLVLLLVKRAGWHEVVDTTTVAVELADTLALGLLVVVVVAGNVVDEVSWPSTELLHEQEAESCNWSVLGQLVELVHSHTNSSSVLLAGPWNENHVTVHVTGGLVVLAVGDLP